MNDISHLGSAGDVLADDLLLDRIAGRLDAGGEPVAGLLVALAAHADSPLPARTGRRRIANKHRYLGAFAALAVAASGAGVAAAVNLPHGGSLLANRDRIEQRMEQSARSSAPSALLSRLGLPATDGTTTARGLVLARGAGGTFVLLPAAAAQGKPSAGQGADGRAGATDATGLASAAGASPGLPGGAGDNGGSTAGPTAPGGPVAAPAVGNGKAPKEKPAKPGKARPGTGAATGTGQVGNGQGANGQGANEQGSVAPDQTGSDPIWVVDPSTGATTTDSTTVPSDTTVAGPAPVGGRLLDPTDQQSLVGPSTSPQAVRRAVVPGVGPSVVPGVGPSATPGAAHSARPSAPQSTNASGTATSAVAAAKQAAAAAAAAAQAAGATPATPASPAAGTPGTAAQPVVPTP